MPNKFILNIQNFFKNFPQKFKQMTMQEKLAYGAIVAGFLLIIVAIILF